MTRKHAVAVATLIGTLLGALLVALGPAQSAQAHGTFHPEYGHLKGHNAVLRRGCHTYHFSYTFTPPEGQWSVETFLTGPGVTHVASGDFLAGSDPKQGQGRFMLCSPTTTPGRFTLRAKLSVQNGPDDYVQGQLPPAHFRLRAPR